MSKNRLAPKRSIDGPNNAPKTAAPNVTQKLKSAYWISLRPISCTPKTGNTPRAMPSRNLFRNSTSINNKLIGNSRTRKMSDPICAICRSARPCLADAWPDPQGIIFSPGRSRTTATTISINPTDAAQNNAAPSTPIEWMRRVHNAP